MSIEIPREVADAEGVPEDLDSAQGTGYRFPSPTRRRIAAAIYLACALAAGLGAWVGLASGLWWAAGGLVVLAGYHLATAWEVREDEHQALRSAGRAVPFAVGHASAALRFEGWLARPVWNVLLYSADDPPTVRSLVRIDARTGAMRTDPYTEQIPAV